MNECHFAKRYWGLKNKFDLCDAVEAYNQVGEANMKLININVNEISVGL